MRVLVTGAAGFIGFHLSSRLLDRGDEVVGLNNLNHYYEVSLKMARLSLLKGQDRFIFHKMDLADREGMARLFAENYIDVVVNLAAQAGVRYSIENPNAYVDSNLVGFINVLEGCRHSKIKHLVYASSSSVYGANAAMPFSIHHNVDHPISLYAATKKANELMAHSYSSLYDIPTTGLRFFTVYGPWGRPDMALFRFTRAILEGKPIDVYNHGRMQRDFTYIDDIVEGIIRVISLIPQANPTWSRKVLDAGTSYAPYRIYNIGNNKPVELLHFIEVLEKHLGKTAEKNYLPLQAGDVLSTYADVDDIKHDLDFSPQTPIDKGIGCFVNWYKSYNSTLCCSFESSSKKL